MKSLSLFALLVTAALAAGCTGTDDPPLDTASVGDDRSDAPAAPATNGGSSRPPASSEPTPPSSSGASSPPPAEGDEAAPAEPVVREIPIAWDGTVGTGYCAPSGPNSCMGIGGLPGLDGGDSFQDTGATGSVGASLTLTWQASTPFTQSMRFAVWSGRSCGDGCFESTPGVFLRATGTSPLTLDLSLTPLGSEETLVLTVDADRLPTPDPVYGHVAVEQPFHVEGTLTVATAP